MQVVVKESSPGTSNSANLSQNRKRKNKKMMQLVIEDDSKRHSHSDVRISDEKRHGGLTNHDQSHTNVQLEPGRHTNVQLEPGRHTNVQTSVSDADFQKSDALRRTDDHLFNELDDVTFNRESRKSGREEFPYFLNFPPVTSSEKKATSYTRISFAKPANFNFDHPGDKNHNLPVVNFINVKRAKFSYEHHFGSFFSSYMYVVKAAETMFIRKIFTFNIDET